MRTYPTKTSGAALCAETVSAIDSCLILFDENAMIANIVNSFDTWLYQIKSLILHRFNHMAPQDYCVMLVVCILVGLVMLRGKR